MKNIFLYKRDSELSEDDLNALREDGFIPIGVASFDDVKIVDVTAAGNTNDVYGAMVEAFNNKSNHGESTRALFGHNLAKRLSDNLAKPNTNESQ